MKIKTNQYGKVRIVRMGHFAKFFRWLKSAFCKHEDLREIVVDEIIYCNKCSRIVKK